MTHYCVVDLNAMQRCKQCKEVTIQQVRLVAVWKDNDNAPLKTRRKLKQCLICKRTELTDYKLDDDEDSQPAPF